MRCVLFSPGGRFLLCMALFCLAVALTAAPPPATGGASASTPAKPSLAVTPWAAGGGRFRVPVLVYNTKDTAAANLRLTIGDVPFLTLINEKKLSTSGSDLRLFDEQGQSLPLRAFRLTSDSGDTQLVFALDALAAKAKRRLWLYYGGSTVKPTVLDGEAMASPHPDITVCTGAEETRSTVAEPKATALTGWLATHAAYSAVNASASGFTKWQPGADLAPWTSSGTVMTAAGGPQDTLQLEVDAPGGEMTAWVRCAQTLPGTPPKGTITLSVARNNKPLATRPPVDLTPRTTPTGDPQSAQRFRWIPLTFTAAKGKVQLKLTSAGSRVLVDAFVLTTDRAYQPDFRDFQGRVWVRWRLEQPQDSPYWAKVSNNLNPYGGGWQLTGSMGSYGLLPGVEGLPTPVDGDYLQPGQYSAWALLPTSGAAQWYSTLTIFPKSAKTPPPDTRVRVEFANRPSAARVFHLLPSEALDAIDVYRCGAIDVRMPTETTLAGLKQVESFREWGLRRARMIEELKLSPPPRLKRLIIGTWDTPGMSGTIQLERAATDLRGLEAIGINAVSMGGITDTTMAALYPKHGIIDTTWTLWAGMYYYTNEGYSGQYKFKEGETPQQRWERVFTDYYTKTVNATRKSSPFMTGLANHLNLGDEIGVATTVDEIVKTPEMLSYFRAWLKDQRLTPADLGAATWDEIVPVDDRKKLDAGGTVAYARLFYWTKRFLLHYTDIFYGAATRTLNALNPKATMAVVNYQAGGMQIGYIGNNNDMDRGTLDIFQLGRWGTFNGAMMEDWVYGWDGGIGRICLGGELLRAAGRKRNQPLASYLVGGEAIRSKYIAYLMHGVKENLLYLYGPVTNIGPAWGESKRALAETADVSRLVKKFEDPIADGRLRPRKAALLIATTSDYMERQGLYFCQERQAAYIALKHGYVQVDIVCEEDITEDNLLKEYALLYVTDPQMRVETQRKIAAWVKDGGVLWACVGAASWDEYNQPCSILDEVFGVRKREMVTQDKGWGTWQHASYGWQPSKMAFTQLGTLKGTDDFVGLEIPVWGARMACEPTTAQVRGVYDDGTPGILVNRHGKGQAMLVGALVGDAYMRMHYPQNEKGEYVAVGTSDWAFTLGESARKLLEAPMERARVPRPVQLSLPGIYTTIMDCPKGTIVFLNNATFAAADTLPKHAVIPTVTVRVQDAGVKAVESARSGPLPFTTKDGEVSFTLRLANVDVIYLRH